MRSIQVTGGFSGDVEVRLTDRKGQNLALSTYKMALLPVKGEAPAVNSTVWQAPAEDEYPKDGLAILTMRPTEAHPLGRLWPAVLIFDSGRPPELVWADDYVELT